MLIVEIIARKKQFSLAKLLPFAIFAALGEQSLTAED